MPLDALALALGAAALHALWNLLLAREEDTQACELRPLDTHEISAARWGTTDELAGPLRAAMLETGRALWRYRIALHDAALTALRG